MEFNLTSLQVRALKGAAASIVLLFLAERRPLNQEYMRRFTGYSAENIHDGVMLLADAGMLIQTGRYTWALDDGTYQQLPLYADGLDAPEPAHAQVDDEQAVIDIDEDTSPDVPDTLYTSVAPKIGAGSLASSRDLNINHNTENLLLASGRISSDFSGADFQDQTSENLAALNRYHIRDPARLRLAGMAHVTPALVEYHCTHSESPGQAIYRIEHNWPVRIEERENKYLNDTFSKYYMDDP
ncbi:MAG: hypothetical protein GYA58_03410 [Anaerolineaceae bacterium]|nr:hypothetical protein [Anaerolineaceae bacterium]